MEARATHRYARISPRKVKIVNDLIRNKPVGVAMGILRNTPKAASELLMKVLASAVANAENNFNMDVDKLYVWTYNEKRYSKEKGEFCREKTFDYFIMYHNGSHNVSMQSLCK